MSRRPPRSTRTDTLLPDDALPISRLLAPSSWRRAQLGGTRGTVGKSYRFRYRRIFVTRSPGMPALSSVRRQPSSSSSLSRYLWRSEEHTSELQSLMRISYAVFCLKKKKAVQQYNTH